MAATSTASRATPRRNSARDKRRQSTVGRPVTRRLPNFLVVGAAKSGTTSIADWLRAHPQAFVAADKELYFFNDDEAWARGVDAYAEHFAAAGDADAVGEATPFYMYFPEAVARMAAVVPDARLIVVAREPVDRAYSNWRHLHYRQATELRSFERLVEDELAEDARLPGAGRCDLDARRHLVHGRYHDQIQLLLEHFPREQLLVLLTDDLGQDPRGTFAAICRFLGIDDTVAVPEVGSRSNTHREFRPVRLWQFLVRHRVLERLPERLGKFIALKLMWRETPPDPLDPRLRALLADYYREPNALLAEFLGRDLSRWG